MVEYYGLSPTEFQIMEFFWEREQSYTFNEIMDYFSNLKEKNWKKQTLHTYLTHLIRKKALKGIYYDTGCKKYERASTKEEYIRQWTMDFLEKTFHGSVGAFVRALTGGGKKLSQNDFNELQAFLDEQKE